MKVYKYLKCPKFFILANFAKGPYYQLSLEALLQDEKLVKGLGPPVRPLFLNLGDKENFVVPEKAQVIHFVWGKCVCVCACVRACVRVFLCN